MEELVGDIVDIVETPPPDTSWISNDDGPFYVGFTYVPATSIIARPSNGKGRVPFYTDKIDISNLSHALTHASVPPATPSLSPNSDRVSSRETWGPRK